MQLKYFSSIVLVSILASGLLSLDADSEECEVRVIRRPNIEHKVFLGDEQRIHCTVTFCNNSPSTVSWFKLEQSDVPVNMSSRLSTEWKTSGDLIGDSILIFHKTVTNDSGKYRCQSGPGVGANIKVSVSVSDRVKTTTEPWMTSAEPGTSNTEETFWPSVYLIVGIMALVFIGMVIFITPKPKCKRVCEKGSSRDEPYLNEQHI